MPPGDVWQCVETCFCCHNLEQGLLLASGKARDADVPPTLC